MLKKMKRENREQQKKTKSPHRDHAYKTLLRADLLDEPEDAAGTFEKALDLTQGKRLASLIHAGHHGSFSSSIGTPATTQKFPIAKSSIRKK